MAFKEIKLDYYMIFCIRTSFYKKTGKPCYSWIDLESALTVNTAFLPTLIGFH